MKPFISIIVPVFKAERYLEECVRSALAQDFGDFEMILVDDGSPDRSGKICDVLAREEPRIRVIHKENGGCNSAREVGVKAAGGDWIMFLDADDFLYSGALAVLVGAASDFPEADIVEGVVRSGKKSRNDGVFSVCSGFLYASRLHTSPGTAVDRFFCGPVAKLIRRELFLKRNVFDSPSWIRTGTDWLMLLRLAPMVRTAVKIGKTVYEYRRNPESLCATNPESVDYVCRRLEEARKILYSGFGDVGGRKLYLGISREIFLRIVAKRINEDVKCLKKMAESLSFVFCGNDDWVLKFGFFVAKLPSEKIRLRSAGSAFVRKAWRVRKVASKIGLADE